ncbi:MAG: MBL fold metallo-hydrolase [Spirochaetaceae bacterium]|nr:MBL fold metallo-hydrolase [Spirochaetaceae bacterium]
MAKTKIVSLDLGMARAYALIGEGGIVLVDSGVPGDGILRALGKAGIDPKMLRLAIVTHAHVDHFGGLEALAAANPALSIAIGALDASSLTEGTDADLIPLGSKGEFAAALTRAIARYASSRPRKPATAAPPIPIRLSGGESLLPYGVEAAVLSTPGHTRGSVSVVVPDAVDAEGRELGAAAIVGDLVMGGFVIHGRPALPFFGRLDEILASLALLREKGVMVLFTGHGGPLDAQTVWRRLGV